MTVTKTTVTKTYHYFIQFARSSTAIINEIQDRCVLEQPLCRRTVFLDTGL
jgi:hypothetical protein